MAPVVRLTRGIFYCERHGVQFFMAVTRSGVLVGEGEASDAYPAKLVIDDMRRLLERAERPRRKTGRIVQFPKKK